MKKGFQLSISVIVTIIIAIVLLGMGIILLNKFIGGAQEIKAELDERTDQQLSVLLESGEKVAVPFNTATIRRGDQKVLGIGIVNIFDETDFKVEISISSAFDNLNEQIDIGNITEFENKWVRYDKTIFPLSQNGQYKGPILFTVPKDAPSGTYIFDAKAISNAASPDAGTYDLKKIYITVP